MERGRDGRGQKFMVSLGYQDYLYRNQITKSKQINKQTKKPRLSWAVPTALVKD